MDPRIGAAQCQPKHGPTLSGFPLLGLAWPRITRGEPDYSNSHDLESYVTAIHPGVAHIKIYFGLDGAFSLQGLKPKPHKVPCLLLFLAGFRIASYELCF